MRKQELDRVRQALETALQNLKEDAAVGEANSESVSLITDRSHSSEDRRSEAPVIVVVAGGSKTHSQGATQARPASLGQTKAPANPGLSDYTERKVSHPGLERFTIEAESNPSAPKACFMEPGRTCVNSGACEMRGY